MKCDLKPFAWFTYEPTAKEPRRTGLYLTSPVDFSDIEVVREFATSKDGTKVPLNILRKKGLKLDAKNPTLLYAYGSKLAVEGGSNGGLLMGAFLTQRPDLAHAVVSHVGIYDMLRIELDPNGQFNIMNLAL